ncbi:pyridoxamine 5'-phosphate oxidase family protein [Marinovum sp.]|uniref:pyridoxamine 5'-phosphate oxidase family protein n=1 Tax=Marinovum sp. TaxID=2024839 RepID=UPI002B271B7D|nr:pyridoxamine 5'-phosphate oxidase family protein [Marinovum sp.]
MTDKVRADARTALFEVLDETRAGMLGVTNSDQHMQPMTHHADRDTAELWFITSAVTDLVKAVGQGASAHYCLTKGDGTFYACLSGRLETSDDRDKLDEVWSVVAAAWFDQGKADADVTLLRLALSDAAIWTATDSAMTFGLEIARANFNTEKKPDLGDHRVIRFDQV